MIIARGRFRLYSKVFDFGEACRSTSFSPRHLQARENNPVTFHRPAGAQRLRRPARKKNDPPCGFMMFSMGDAQKHSPSSTSPCRTTGTPGTRPSMSPSRRTICSTWPFVDGVRHAGSMKEIARITDGSAATYRCLISINARTIYVVVWAALIYRSQACVWRRRWNYVFSSKGLDHLSGNYGTGSDGIACGKQKGCIDCDLGAFGWCVGECSLIEGD